MRSERGKWGSGGVGEGEKERKLNLLARIWNPLHLVQSVKSLFPRFFLLFFFFTAVLSLSQTYTIYSSNGLQTEE
jgi:hypothetical protein